MSLVSAFLLTTVLQSVPLSLFKIWPFGSCGSDNSFEVCPTDINSRKVLRKTLSDGPSMSAAGLPP